MLDKASKNAVHRKAVWTGLAVSAAAHVAVLTFMTVPAWDFGAGEGEADRIALTEFEAIDVIQLPTPEPVEPPPPSPDEVATVDAQGAVATEVASAAPNFDQLISELGEVSYTAEVPATSRPVITFADLEPTSNTAAVMASIAIEQGLLGEDEDGDIEGLLGALSASLSGGGHCPTPETVGPVILR